MNKNNYFNLFEKKLIYIINKINLSPFFGNSEKEIEINAINDINNRIKAGYKLIENNKTEIKIQLKNTFLASIKDVVKYMEEKNKTYEDLDFIEKEIENNTINLQGNKYFLTGQQSKIFELTKNNDNFIISLPTSSGKSFIIRIIACQRLQKNKRTIIITPTISLLNEYKIEIKNMGFYSSTHSLSSAKILILTQERAINLEFNEDDLLIVDEAYVIAAMDDRAGILVNVIKNAKDKKVNIKLFMPNIYKANKLINIQNFNNSFKSYENFISLSTRDSETIKCTKKEWFDSTKFNNQSIVIFDTALKKWLDLISEKNIKPISLNENCQKMIFFLKNEFGEQFKPIKMMQKGFIFSHSKYPKIFRFISEIFYKKKYVKTFISTSTITKGVNLRPDKIAIFTKNARGQGPIDLFELRNAVGRVGRYDSNIANRIGTVEFVSKKNIFKENMNELIGSYIPSSKVNLDEGKKMEMLEKYDFNSVENFDWIKGKYGLSKKEIEIWVKNGNQNEFKEYIEFKYSKKNSVNNFENIWNKIWSQKKLKEKILSLGKLKLLKRYDKNGILSDIEIDMIRNTFFRQGFNEALRPTVTFIQSIRTEFSYLKNREQKLFFDISSDRIAKNYCGNKGFIIDNNISKNNENILLDFLIFRKTEINNIFLEGFLNPLDSIIAEILGIEQINAYDNIDEKIESSGLIIEFKQYIISKIKNKKYEDIQDIEVNEVIKKDIYLQSILKEI